MARRSDIAPYRQGQLDGLCGLYAIINAIRLATHDRTDEFGHGVWRELLLALWRGRERGWNGNRCCARHRHKAAVRAC
jgi:hypothetical protein